MVQPLHDTSDPRNAAILINVDGVLTPRAEARHHVEEWDGQTTER